MNNNRGKTMKRLFNFVISRHRNTCIVILLLIIISSLSSVMGSIFIKSLIDDYITPYLNTVNPDFNPLLNAILKMVAIYAIGVIATYTFNKLLINVSQGSLKEIRDTMFEHMEQLPIRYFDTHNHGDIMSIYTNDTDTLRQMISQSIPQVIVSATTIICVFVSMLVMSIPLTIISVIMVCVMLGVSKYVTNRSGKYFFAQQTNLGRVNGFVEEMMEGQKVVKVFCYEDESKARFDKLNEIIVEQDFLEQEIQRIDEEHKSSFSKMEVYKYNAFSDMGGETSFVIALLDHNNNGTLLNGMSSQNATYVYAKEIRNGASKVALSNEEKLTLEKCINK